MKVPTIMIGPKKEKLFRLKSKGFLSMFIGFSKKPLDKWPTGLEISKIREEKKEKSRQYFHDKKGG